MGSGYDYKQPDLTGLQKQFQSYLGTQIGQEAPGYGRPRGASMPQGLMDLRGMYSYLLGQGGRGGVGTTSEGFPMPATGAFPAIPMPGVLGTTEAGLTEMMETGMPTATKEWERARKTQFEQQLSDELTAQMAERHAFGGRYASGAQRAIAETTGRAGLGYATEVGRRQIGSMEAARGRQMGAYGMGMGLGGLQEQILAGRMGGAAGLETGIWGMEQSQADREYQEWLRRQPGYRPEFGMTGQVAGQYPGQWMEDPAIGFINSLIGAGGTAAGGGLQGKAMAGG